MGDLQHIAYEVSLSALRDAKRRAVHDFFSKVDCYEPEDGDDLNTVVMNVERAFELCCLAQKVARQMMQAHDHSKAVEVLRKRLPGYSAETYTQAISEAFARQAR